MKVERKGDIESVNANVIDVADGVHGIKTQLDTVTGELKADMLNVRESKD